MDDTVQPTKKSSWSLDGKIGTLPSSQRSSVRFSRVSTIRMMPLEEVEGEDFHSAASSSDPRRSLQGPIIQKNRKLVDQERRPMGYKSRRRKVHQLLMEDYVSRRNQQLSLLSPNTSEEECCVSTSSASCSDISTLSSDSNI
ncbi:hypothetical protein IV203_027084 [Nitzschia inconspicua]|uniref:Uncharacterized protein n=1 Tax=Nitzschia inconspicua TaxID=303405 RepID=A0A9K3LL67_9STRA|nr:hypothetical protein IV203_027084 [Nitzschia inconspicua]